MSQKTWGQEIWDKKSSSHDATGVILGLGKSSKDLEKSTAEVLNIFDRHFLDKIPQGSEILDVGTGPLARFSIALAKKGYKITGMDISDVSLAHAKTQVNASSQKVELIKGDMTKFQLGRLFDGIFCVEAFFHIPSHLSLAAFNSFNQHLKPNGKLLIQFCVLNQETPGYLAYLLLYMTAFKILTPIMKLFGRKTFHVTVVKNSEVEIKDLAELTGFKIVSREGNYFVFEKISAPKLQTHWV